MEGLKKYQPYIISFIALVYICIEATGPSKDFTIFLSASQDLYAGENMYAKTYFDGYHYLYWVR